MSSRGKEGRVVFTHRICGAVRSRSKNSDSLPKLTITLPVHKMSSGAQCLCLVMLATAASAENFTWLGLAVSDQSTQPPARHSAAMGARGGHLYLFGGQGNKKNGTTLLGQIRRACLLGVCYSATTDSAWVDPATTCNLYLCCLS